jgi:hypothetical protein
VLTVSGVKLPRDFHEVPLNSLAVPSVCSKRHELATPHARSAMNCPPEPNEKEPLAFQLVPLNTEMACGAESAW